MFISFKYTTDISAREVMCDIHCRNPNVHVHVPIGPQGLVKFDGHDLCLCPGLGFTILVILGDASADLICEIF